MTNLNKISKTVVTSKSNGAFVQFKFQYLNEDGFSVLPDEISPIVPIEELDLYFTKFADEREKQIDELRSRVEAEVELINSFVSNLNKEIKKCKKS